MDGGIIPQSTIEKLGLGEQVVKMRFEGKTLDEIARNLSVNIHAVDRYLKKQKNVEIIRENSEKVPDISTKGKVLYEINRTIAESHLSQQLAEFEKNYYNAMQRQDEKAAYAWSQRWGEALDKILKVTGAYQSPPVKVEPIQININWKSAIKKE